MTRFLGFLKAIVACAILLLLISSTFDPYFSSRINGSKSGEVPLNDIVFYRHEDDQVIRNNGSIILYEPAELYCVSRSGSSFKLGELASDSMGVLPKVEAYGFLELQGSSVDCHIKTLSDQPVPYSIADSYKMSSVIALGIFLSIFALALVMAIGIAELIVGNTKK